MKQLLILSGKGGTGKTTIASALIKLSQTKGYADCDVDAPNLHLVTKQFVESEDTHYYGMPKAYIDTVACTNCSLCYQFCRFGAVNKGEDYVINAAACEGCSVCEMVCPRNAISMIPTVSGNLHIYKDDKVFATASLKIGSGNSGLLVTEVKKQLKDNAKDVDIAIIDGSPGIGCPVIASLSGVDLVLIVAEPTLSGISDMERIIRTAKLLYVDVAVCINKSDINLENSDRIDEICKENGIDKPIRIPFDKSVPSIINSGKTIVDTDCDAKQSVVEVYDSLVSKLL